MDFNKRVARFSRIQIIEPPADIGDWYEKQEYTIDEVTVFKIRDFIFSNADIENKLMRKTIFSENELDRIENFKNNELLVQNTNNIEELMDMLAKTEFIDLKIIILDRLVLIDRNVYKIFIEILKRKYNDHEFDNSLRVFIRAMKNIDISDDLLNLLKDDFIRDPQDFASLVQLLGVSGRKDLLKYLYSFYEYFQYNFSNENYYEGPLFGILYYLKRNRITIAST